MSKGGAGRTQTSDPWSGIQPYLTDLYGRAQQASGATPQYFPGQTYAGLNQTQTGALSGIMDYSGQLQNMTGSAQNAWLGQLTPEQTAAQQAGGSLMPGATNFLSGAMGGMGIDQPVSAAQYGGPSVLNNMMSGQVDMGVYDQLAGSASRRMTDAFTQDILPSIRDEGIMTGAYGGSRQDLATIGATDTLQQNMGDMLSSLYGGAYDTAMQQRGQGAELASRLGSENASRAMQAQQLAQQGRMGEATAMLNAAGLSSDLISQGSSNQLSQSGNIMSALGLAPTMGQFGMSPYQNMLNVGGVYQGQDQLGIDEAMSRYNFEQNAPWQVLQNYSGILGGIPMGGYGTTQTQSRSNPGANALGTGLGAFALGANPWAAGAMGLASLL